MATNAVRQVVTTKVDANKIRRKHEVDTISIVTDNYSEY